MILGLSWSVIDAMERLIQQRRNSEEFWVLFGGTSLCNAYKECHADQKGQLELAGIVGQLKAFLMAVGDEYYCDQCNFR